MPDLGCFQRIRASGLRDLGFRYLVLRHLGFGDLEFRDFRFWSVRFRWGNVYLWLSFFSRHTCARSAFKFRCPSWKVAAAAVTSPKHRKYA